MGLPKGRGVRGKRPAFRELPYKYKVNTDSEKDGEAEISRKKALLRLNSQRVYMQAGSATKALDSLRDSMKWLRVMSENMDKEEVEEVAPLLDVVSLALKGMGNVHRQKINAAAQMERELEKEVIRVRSARLRLARMAAKKAADHMKMRVWGIPEVSLGDPL